MNGYLDYVISGIKFGLWILLIAYILIAIIVMISQAKHNVSFKEYLKTMILVLVFPIVYIFGLIVKLFNSKKYDKLKEKKNENKFKKD